MRLDTPLQKVLRTTKDHIDVLEGMGLRTVEDMLLYLPRAHEDLSAMATLRTAPRDAKATLRGLITSLKRVRTRHGKSLVTGRFLDEEGGQAEVIWFNQPHIMRMLADGDEVVLTGKVVEVGRKLQIQSSTFEPESENLVHAGKLVPVYPQHDIINTRWLREKMMLLKDAAALFPETLPEEIIKEEHFLSRADAIRALHFPESGVEVEEARRRLAFEQMYDMQCEVLQRKMEWQGQRHDRLKTPMDVELIRRFFASLHFTPTASQKIAMYEILKDMERDIPMSRLLEGDVGSGKTLVATGVIANVIRHGGQVALMVPTEVLARQHVQSIGKMLIQLQTFSQAAGVPVTLHPTVGLLTGSLPGGEADDVRRRLAAGTIDLVIGTHALIQDKVQFKDLKLVIVDEQHRFGVVQREKLREKGSPHFLAMTATPIPRTLALTAHGHHDLSVLLEKPGNRRPIDTTVVSPSDRSTVERFINHQIDEGRQVFVICPLIADSENEDMAEIKSVEQEAKRLQQSFPNRRVAVLHGQMVPTGKEKVMAAFKAREQDILVSTSVIEVGIDVPNASIIIIEGAERFGLAQLHQFRGRVGRGDHKSHCFLFTTTPTQATSQRLKAMEQYDSGFQLAEIDLQLRGPGELYGLRQSGLLEGRIQGLLDPELVVRARQAAERTLQRINRRAEALKTM